MSKLTLLEGSKTFYETDSFSGNGLLNLVPFNFVYILQKQCSSKLHW